MTLKIVEEIVDRYKTLCFLVDNSSDGTRINFKADSSDKLSYSIWISRECVNAEISASSEEVEQLIFYFWYCPLGMSKDEFNFQEIKEFIFEYLDKIANFRTRVVQRKNWISQSFRLEYYENLEWKLIYKHRALSFTNIEFPEIKDNEKIYY